MRVYQALAKAFVAQGTQVVFNLMGDGIKLWLVEMASAPGVQLVNTRHEGAALAMADGYARASGRVGVCAVTYGPGVTQLSTSLMVARKRGSPIVVFAADIASWLRDGGDQLDVDERALLEAAGAKVRELRDPRQSYEVVARVFDDARTERRPVALLVASDLQEFELPADLVAPGQPVSAHAVRAAPDPLAVCAAAELVSAARRPLLLAGRGAVLAGARPQLDDLAERIGAVVTTTFGAKGWLDDHPRNVGLSGGFALDSTRDVLAQSDCVIAVGAGLNDHTTDHGRLFSGARVVQIDKRPRVPISRRVAPDLYIQSDAAIALELLAAELERKRHRPAGWPQAVLDRIATGDPRREQLAANPVECEPGRMDPRELMLALDVELPDDALVLIGGGHFMGFVAQYLSNPSRRSFEMVFDFMTTGQVVPAAIGASLARPGRLVVAFEGDASFMMHVQEIDTGARYGAAPLVVVLNDEALGAEYHKLRAAGHDAREALVPTPDLARLASALGGRGRRIGAVDQMDGLLGWYDASAGPHVVDCPVSRRVVGPE